MFAPDVGTCVRLRVGVEGIMTDAGGFDPKSGTSSADERVRLLGQIAEALKIPVSTFHGRGGTNALCNGPSATECAALLAAFARIDDPDRRKECLAIVERFGKR
ncbi:hypothetical protein [Methylobacterium sp. SI9]|uniref:hypothetical protein n=1 Tax=Methylobacterium guangdongense TaxID=3138811 RepID=UPI00313DA15A